MFAPNTSSEVWKSRNAGRANYNYMYNLKYKILRAGEGHIFEDISGSTAPILTNLGLF